ncbi:MAG: glycosyltransferase [Planctomycetes bacterium]|nr:glycosyltransferase [Planctomycetota bacterium]
MTPPLGCVLAIRDRPPEYLERTLQTFAYQATRPADQVLVDFGSAQESSAEYERLCGQYGWRFLRPEPAPPHWNLSAAYNTAVHALDPRVEVVFKSDVDVLLGQGVLSVATERGREKLCIFSCLATAAGTTYPPQLQSHADLLTLLAAPEPPVMMWGEGIHAFPRTWFIEAGGYDLQFQGWGFEDSDLRERARWSIGVVHDTTSLLLHQWHPRTEQAEGVARNRAYYDKMRATGQVVRNRGILLPSLGSPASEPVSEPEEETVPEAGEPRVAFATRSRNETLCRLSWELLGPDRDRFPRYRLTGSDCLGYFRALRDLDADWVVNLDEDAFVLDPGRLQSLIRHLQAQGYAACGMPDGGVVPIRRHNPVACNAAFTVFDLRRVRRAWRDWEKAAGAGPRPEHEALVAPFARRSSLAFDRFEPYYGLFFTLLDAGERLLYLDAEPWEDGITTLIKDHEGAPLLLHAWFSRAWEHSHHTRRRLHHALDHARRTQGLGPAAIDTGPQQPNVPEEANDSAPLVPPSAQRVLEIEGTDPADLERPLEEGGPWDCIVGLNVLAQVQDPLDWLRRARARLAEGGRLVVGAANLGRQQVLAELLDDHGEISADPGRPGHLGGFTRREVEKLLDRTGFRVAEVRRVPGPGHEDWVRQGRLGEVTVGPLTVRALARGEAEDLHTEFFLFSAALVALPLPGLTSIIILTYNQLPYTQLCVDSVRHYTDEPYELVFVDNGSTDGTLEYLRALPDVTVIANPANLGFPAAANQGLRAARGDQVLLLNNDTVATSGWLRRLLAPLAEDPKVGLVGPCSNAVSGPQQVPVPYRDLADLDGFAWEWAQVHPGECLAAQRLVGFCLLFRRELLERVGYLDERFGMGCFEDDDYCRRALDAGYRAVIARDAFVHHFGSQTFRGSGVDLGALLRRNHQVFLAKWAPGSPAQCPTGEAPGWAEGDVRLSLCMIVRDNARTLEACLTSIRPWVDEMVVVDTGSTDATPQIAERLGARVFSFPWCDDFAAARNESFRHARGRWLFWMDSDDVIDAANGRRLRGLTDPDPGPSVLGYVMQVHCPGPGEDGGLHTTVVDHVKLVRNLPGVRFEGRIHEQVLMSIRRLGGEVAWTDVFVVHAGHDFSPQGQHRKRERDLRLLHLEHRERGDHPFTLFNLGMTYADSGRYREAIGYLRGSIAHAAPGESHLRKAYALLVYCHHQVGERDAAWAACREGLALTPADPELGFRAALLLHERGQVAEAAATYERLLAAPPERQFGSLDQGILGFKARQNLALVYQDLGDWGRAEEQWRRIVADQPGYRVGWRGLVEGLLHRGRLRQAEAVVEGMPERGSLRAEKWLLRGQVAAAQGNLEEARRALERAVAAAPEDEPVRQALCRFLFDHGTPEEAEQALRELADRHPEDASARHNLGTVYLRLGRPAEAVEAYRQSLRLRPHAPATAQLLEQALRQGTATK